MSQGAPPSLDNARQFVGKVKVSKTLSIDYNY